MKKLILLIAVAFLFVSCEEHNYNSKIVTIDAVSKKTYRFKDIFENIKLIKSETNTDGLVGVTVTRMEVYKDKMFFLNQTPTHVNILCFDTIGDFLFKIDRIGGGPEEYDCLNDFFIDEINNHLILSVNSDRFLICNLDGVYLHGVSSSRYVIVNQMVISDSTCFMFVDANDEGDLIRANVVTMDINQSYLINENFMNIGNRPLSVHNKNVLFVKNNDTIYNVTDLDSISAAYFIDFGKEQLKIKNDVYKKGILDENLFLENVQDGLLKLVYSIFENDKYIFINCVKDMTKHTFSTIIYDKKLKRTYNSEYMDLKFDSFRVLYTNNNKTYCLVEQDVNHKITDSKYLSENDKAILNNYDPLDNPLIFVFE